MRLAGLLILIFMVSALGGWFGFRQAAENTRYSLPREELAGEVAALKDRIAALEAPVSQGEESVVAADEAPPIADTGLGKSSLPVKEPAAPKWTPAEREQYEARANRDTIIFTDLQGRVVKATVTAVDVDRVWIIREQDRRRFELPLELLVPTDRGFVEYLVESGRFSSEPRVEEKADVDEIDWDAIFGM